MAQWHKRGAVSATVMGSIPTQGNCILCFYIFISSLWYKGKKSGVEFRHSARKASQIIREVGNAKRASAAVVGSIFTRGNEIFNVTRCR